MARIWDALLTERDREHVARFPARTVGFGARPAVLMVDNFRQALGDEPRPLMEAVETWPHSTGLEGWAAIERCAVLLRAARARNLPVAHVTGLLEDESGVRGWFEVGQEREAPHRSPQEAAQHAQRYDIVPEVAPVLGEAFLRKAAPSAFWGTPLMAFLTDRGVDTLIIGGESTSGCVRSTVGDAASHRFRVIVVEDCTYDRVQASHAMALFDMDRKYADVLSLDAVLAQLGDVPA